MYDLGRLALDFELHKGLWIDGELLAWVKSSCGRREPQTHRISAIVSRAGGAWKLLIGRMVPDRR
jgi:hypothetical protein